MAPLCRDVSAPRDASQRQRAIEHCVVRAVHGGTVQIVGRIQLSRRERLARLLQAVLDQRLQLLRFRHPTTPSLRILATSVLADIAPSSNSAREKITGASSVPCSNPI